MHIYANLFLFYPLRSRPLYLPCTIICLEAFCCNQLFGKALRFCVRCLQSSSALQGNKQKSVEERREKYLQYRQREKERSHSFLQARRRAGAVPHALCAPVVFRETQNQHVGFWLTTLLATTTATKKQKGTGTGTGGEDKGGGCSEEILALLGLSDFPAFA